MPIYQCRCPKCSHEFEEFAKVDDRDAIACAQCHAVPVDRVPSKPATERRFAGSESMSRRYEFIPSDVERMRRITADSGARIDDTGHVWFDGRGQERKFQEAIERMTVLPPEESAAVDSDG